MVKPMAVQPSRSASSTEPKIAWSASSFRRDRLLEWLSFRMVGTWPYSLPVETSSWPSGAA